jgi:hypothetical protein
MHRKVELMSFVYFFTVLLGMSLPIDVQWKVYSNQWWIHPMNRKQTKKRKTCNKQWFDVGNACTLFRYNERIQLSSFLLFRFFLRLLVRTVHVFPLLRSITFPYRRSHRVHINGRTLKDRCVTDDNFWHFYVIVKYKSIGDEEHR